jgi:hypothetical protein
MKYLTLVVVLGFGFSPFALGQNGGRPRSRVEGQILALEREWISAMERSDSAADFMRILADNYALTSWDGGVTTKAVYLADPLDNPFVRLKPEGVKVRAHRGTAITSGRMTIELKGRVENVSYNNVYWHKDGRWRLVSTQFTRIERE